MKEFVSSNGVPMVEGELFNWQKDDPFNISISIGTMSKMYVFGYDIQKKILSMFEMTYGTDYINEFYFEELVDAEKVVVAFGKANKYEILPLYEKPGIIISKKDPFL